MAMSAVANTRPRPVAKQINRPRSEWPPTQLNEYFINAFEFFNEQLFGGDLKPVMLYVQRKNKALGFFRQDEFESAGDNPTYVHELGINPAYFKVAGRGTAEVLSTLVHEMVHLWQQEYGKPGKSGNASYHNREWADKMKELGLQPWKVDSPVPVTLKKFETGFGMSHFIIKDGPFDTACTSFLKGNPGDIPWAARSTDEDTHKKKTKKKKSDGKTERARSSKVRFCCIHHGETVVWGKKSTQVQCAVDDCGVLLIVVKKR